jgi:hypothetical protein
MKIWCEYAAEGLTFGNSVYWIWFDEEYSDKVIFFSMILLLQEFLLCVQPL